MESFFNVNFNILLNQLFSASVGNKTLIVSRCTVRLWKKEDTFSLPPQFTLKIAVSRFFQNIGTYLPNYASSTEGRIFVFTVLINFKSPIYFWHSFFDTNLIHNFLYKLYKIKFLYMFRASSAHLQEVNDVNCTCMQPLVFYSLQVAVLCTC